MPYKCTQIIALVFFVIFSLILIGHIFIVFESISANTGFAPTLMIEDTEE